MNKYEMMAWELVGRVAYYKGQKLTGKQARDALDQLVRRVDEIDAARDADMVALGAVIGQSKGLDE